jgi:hypothetical protein
MPTRRTLVRRAMPTRRRIIGAGLETRGHGAHAIDRDRGAAMGLRAFAHPTLLSHEHRRRFSVVWQRKIREQRRKRERHHEISLDRAPPGRLDFEIERVRSGVDEIVERIAACSFASALGAPRRGTRSRAPARCFGFAFMPPFGLLHHCGPIRSLSSAHSRPCFGGGSNPEATVRGPGSHLRGGERNEPFYIGYANCPRADAESDRADRAAGRIGRRGAPNSRPAARNFSDCLTNRRSIGICGCKAPTERRNRPPSQGVDWHGHC